MDQGEFVGVMGPSGSGKTTLLHCISCYLPATAGGSPWGSVPWPTLDEAALAAVRNQQLGFVFQDFLLLDGLTVRQNILLPAIIGGAAGPGAEERADQLCQVFGLTPLREKYPAEISGGEKQRTAVARALINHPLLILADEPTGNLDSQSSRRVIDAFQQARAALGATILMVTHDSFAASFCDRVVILRDGVVWRVLAKGEQGPAPLPGPAAGRHPGYGKGVRPCRPSPMSTATSGGSSGGNTPFWRGCAFFSTLLITAYACMMRSPTILTVLPEGGDSRNR